MDTEYHSVAQELIRFNARLGLRQRLTGVQYGRLQEFALVCRALPLDASSRLLDLGSGKHSVLPWFCALRTGCRAWVTDIGEAVWEQQRRARANRALKAMLDEGQVVVELQDATHLTYANEAFDAVTAISTLEHIPGDGDSVAVREAYRVLKPGGMLALTVPCAFGKEHIEHYRRRDSYAAEYRSEPVFFGHVYDEASLRARIVEAAPFTRHEVQFWGDNRWYRDVWMRRVPFRNFWKHCIGWWLTQRSLATMHPVASYSGSEAWLAVVLLSK